MNVAELQRYYNALGCMDKRDDGDWVKFSDVEKLVYRSRSAERMAEIMPAMIDGALSSCASEGGPWDGDEDIIEAREALASYEALK